VRKEVTYADLVVMLSSARVVLETTTDVAPRAWRRHLGFALDGFRADGVSPPAAPTLTDAQLAEAMRTLRVR
jgi:hypothetical protein